MKMNKNNYIRIASATLVACLAMSSAASALSFRILTENKGVDLSCTKSCEVWDLALDPDGFRSTPVAGTNADSGDWLSASYGGINNSNGNSERLTFVNNVVGTSFAAQSESSDVGAPGADMRDYSGGDSGGWTTSSRYLLTWGGPDPRYVLIKNNSVDNVFTWGSGFTSGTQSGSGLSGVDGFGVVPLPAAAWLLMFASGCLMAAKRIQSRRSA